MSDTQADKKILDTYEKEDEVTGRIPTLFHHLNKKYVNMGYTRVQRVVRSSTSYQLYSARQTRKPAGKGQVDSGSSVGVHLEADLMFFSLNDNGILKKTKNDGYTGLLVIVDANSGYVGALALRTKPETTGLAKKILKAFPFGVRGGTLMVDSGAEFIGANSEKSNYFTSAVNALGLKLSVLPTGRAAPHVEGKNNETRTNVNEILARKKSKRWIDVYKTVVRGLNTTPLTDWRAPHTPLEITKMSKKAQKQLFFQGKKAKGKKTVKGPKLRELEVGESVRIALEAKVKGAKIG